MDYDIMCRFNNNEFIETAATEYQQKNSNQRTHAHTQFSSISQNSVSIDLFMVRSNISGAF